MNIFFKLLILSAGTLLLLAPAQADSEHCVGPMQKVKVFEPYYTPVFKEKGNRRLCDRAGSCIIRKQGQDDIIYSYGIGTRKRSQAEFGCTSGLGVNNRCLNNYKTIAASDRFPVGTVLFFKELRDKKIGDKYHDGFVRVDDRIVKSKIKNEFRFFVGECSDFERRAYGRCKEVHAKQFYYRLDRTKFCVADPSAFKAELLDTPASPAKARGHIQSDVFHQSEQ